MNFTAVQSAWALAGTMQLSPLTHGTNNAVWRVRTPAGDYVLRVYRNHGELARLRFEHAVLLQLQAAGLPFAVPAPLPTASGEYFAWLAREDTEHGEALATLTALIPGEHPRRDDLAQAEAAGEALGLLDATLARITPPDPAAALSWRSYGDLEHCHPLVPEPRAALAELPVAPDLRSRLLARYDWLRTRIPGLYAALPQQIAHEDCAPDNVLMQAARVTGVLDFEFCARDLRVMDLTVALSWWPVAQFGSGEEWPILAAVARGFAQHLALAPDEIAAIPTVFELRAYTSLIHRLGRHRAGLSPLAAVVERAAAAAERAAWVAANGARLVEVVAVAVNTDRSAT
jgi:homoserine kinase type II